jgi:hypothetical protein
MNSSMLFFLLFAAFASIAFSAVTNKKTGDIKVTLAAGGISFLVAALVIIIVFYVARGAATSDTEIWSGVLTSKQRVHDTYEESYECNCHTTRNSKGTTSRSCDTCWRTHYTVDWYCNSNIGRFKVDGKDSLSSSVYMTPNPAFYDHAQPGDPVSRTNTYTNYAQAVPDSLYHRATAEQLTKFKNLIPPYPDKIYDLYKIDRFLSPGLSFADARQWNTDISMMLRDLGAKKQVNFIVVIAKTDDQSYMYALRDAWEGANKNDVVLLIGSPDGTSISWVDVITWSTEELFKIELRDRVLAMKTINREAIMTAARAQIEKNFVRRHGKEFKYLEDVIDPPLWLEIVLVILLVLGYGGAVYALLQPRFHRGGYRF